MLSFLKSNGWNISERGYRSLLRSLFVMTVVMPTLGLGLLVALTSTDWYRESRRLAWQTELQQQLGVGVQIGSVSESKPGSFVARDIEFLHPESGEKLASINTISGQKRSDSWEVELLEPVIETTQLNQLWHAVHDWKIRRPSSKRRVIRVSAKRLQFRGADSHQFNDLVFSYASQPDETRAKLSMTPHGMSNLKPLEICLRRMHLGDSLEQVAAAPPAPSQNQLQGLPPFTTRVIVDAAHCQLPLKLICPFLGETFGTDTQATVNGLMCCDLTPRQTKFSLYSGSINHLNFEDARAILPFEIQGTASINLDFLKLVNNQIVELRSQIIGKGSGQILDAQQAGAFFTANNLSFNNDVVTDNQPTIPFRDLNLNLRVDVRGVTLAATGEQLTNGQTTYHFGMMHESGQHCVLFQTEKQALSIEKFADLYPASNLPNDRLSHRRRVLAHLSYPLDEEDGFAEPIIAHSADAPPNRVAAAENLRH